MQKRTENGAIAPKVNIRPKVAKNPQPSLDQATIIFKGNPVAS